MEPLQRLLRAGFFHAEGLLDRAFGPAWNPLYALGALGFFYYWVVAASGIYVYIFFDTGTTEAYQSVQYLTEEQWYLGGVMRSLHRYASDGMVLMMGVHILREFSLGRFRGARWFTWITGLPVLWLVFVAGISGYWLVWDELAQFVAIYTTEWLDWLGIFGQPIARNFLTPRSLDDRFFTLLTFIHIVAPLLLLLVLWIHLQRVSRPKINPQRGLAVGTFVMLLALSFVKPAVSHAPADLTLVPTVVHLDWYYLVAYPLMDLFSYGTLWALAVLFTLSLALLPLMPPFRRAPAAVVDLANCNGCSRCADDCPYNAITMVPRSDSLPFEHEARVSPSLCVSCGICTGACPTATPFRRASELTPGIDLPHLTVRELRSRLDAAVAELAAGPRVLVFGCDHGAKVERLRDQAVAAISLPCIAALPPSFIDYALSRSTVDGVFITGCREGECYNRFGIAWMDARMAGTRDPYLRRRVPRQRIGKLWAGSVDDRQLARAVAAFRDRLAALAAEPPAAAPRRPTPTVAEEAETHG